MDDLVKEGKIAAGTGTDVARAYLAAGVRAGAPKTDISTPEAMKRRLLAAKSITFAKEGAATAAINKMIDRLGIAEQLKSKLVLQTAAGGKAEETVAAGENEIVFAPVSEIIPVKGIEVLGLFPKEFQVPLIMTAALGANAQDVEGAQAFVKFLTSPAAVGAIKASGMEPVGKKNSETGSHLNTLGYATRSLAVDRDLGFSLTAISTSRPSKRRSRSRRSIEKADSFPCLRAEILG